MARTSIKILDNVDDLLSQLGVHGPQPVPDLARRMSIPRSSVYRLVDAAVHAGLAQTRDDGTIGLGVGLLRLAAAAARQNPLVTAAAPVLQDVRDSTRQTVYLCSRRDDEIVCLLRYQGLSVGLLELVPGGSLPPYAGATSRVISANDPDLLASEAAVPTRQFTVGTLATVGALNADAAEVRARGFAVSDGDVTQGVAELGVPVWRFDGTLAGAISIAGMRHEVIHHRGASVQALQDASATITQRLTT